LVTGDLDFERLYNKILQAVNSDGSQPQQQPQRVDTGRAAKVPGQMPQLVVYQVLCTNAYSLKENRYPV